MSQLTVSIVIPSWNSEKQLKQNLRYVYTAAKEVKAEIIIIDDASSDNSSQYLDLQSKLGKIRFYKNRTNQGFAYTVNRGVKLAKGDIVVLLNTDVRPSKYAFQNCLRLFTQDSSLFAVTFNSGQGWAGGKWHKGMFHHFKVEPNDNNKNQLNPSLWASGGQAAFDRRKWLSLQGMDFLYKPFYWEDVDLGYRAWKRGWRIVWDFQSKVVHDHQQSVIANNFSRQFILDTAQRNQFLFIWKNIHDSKLILSHLFHLPLFIIKYPKPFFRALLLLPQVLVKRHQEKQQSLKTDKAILTTWSTNK